MEYEGSASGPVNSGVVDGDGNASLGAVIGGAIGQLAADGWNVINGVFGIPSALASNYGIMVAGKQVGITILPGVSGMTLDQALAAKMAQVDMIGNIIDRAGHWAGRIDFDAPPGVTTIGPLNADINTEDVQTVVSQDGNAVFESVRVPLALSRMLRSVDGHALKAVTRYWVPSVCSTDGVPLMDWQNMMNVYPSSPGAVRAFLKPRLIGGIDGIYDLPSGRRVMPPQGLGYPAPAGFHLGASATFQRFVFGMGWTSGGYAFMWGTSGDHWAVLDPSTNAYPSLAAYFQVCCWDGSQQISTLGYPQFDYPTSPHPGDPRYNTRVPNIVAETNLPWICAAFQGYTGQGNGGPDGGPQ